MSTSKTGMTSGRGSISRVICIAASVDCRRKRIGEIVVSTGKSTTVIGRRRRRDGRKRSMLLSLERDVAVKINWSRG